MDKDRDERDDGQRTFQRIEPHVKANDKLRVPQRESFQKLKERLYCDDGGEYGIVLPVGCGKSGCITLTPFSLKSKRALVVAPGVEIAKQLMKDFHPSQKTCFYRLFSVLESEFPEPVEIRGKSSNLGDVEEADVVVTNIHQLQRGEDNKWLNDLPDDFFDLIIFDEGHHNVAQSWDFLRRKFSAARIVNYTATPCRADGKKMSGEIIYTYPVADAIKAGYAKRLTGLVLCPESLKYVRQDSPEIEVSLEEVRRLGEEDAKFRRSIVTSEETLTTIVDASLNELDRLREKTGCNTLKIIASALNYEHCQHIVRAYRERSRRADFIHSKEDGQHNLMVLKKLENDELDIIVQVRKLGEGFNHPKLAVAAVFSVFSHLSPFVQFVGRVMRALDSGNPGSVLNQGVVVFHAGSNVASRWEDFQEFSEADQKYFSELLPLVENMNFESSSKLQIQPNSVPFIEEQVEIREQKQIGLQEIPLLRDESLDSRLIALVGEGYSQEDIMKSLERIHVTKADRNSARISTLDSRVQNAANRLLSKHKIPGFGSEFDKQRLGRTNFVIVKSAIDRKINKAVGIKTNERHELRRSQLDLIDERFKVIVLEVESELFNVSV